MNTLTICYSTHRLETLELTSRVMEQHDIIIMEEPPHADFEQVLKAKIDLKLHLLELDLGYPKFTEGQYRLLQKFYKNNKQILQIEPYLEHLIDIHDFFAEGHGPDEIAPNTIASAVYSAERHATGLLIDYYEKVRGDDFGQTLYAMNAFAKADASRFILRDTLRVANILEVLQRGKKVYIEAGSIHLLLYKLLAAKLPEEWHLQVHSVDREAAKMLHRRGSLFSPGDILTLHYIWGHKVSTKKWQMACAQSLIYSKIITKDEMNNSDASFPHTRNELEAIAAVRQLSTESCRMLFQRIRSLSSEEAAEVVEALTTVRARSLKTK